MLFRKATQRLEQLKEIYIYLPRHLQKMKISQPILTRQLGGGLLN